MIGTALIDRLRHVWRNFRAANRANVTVTFALSTIPIVGFVGAAIDYSHANSVKTALQAATDATALMLSKTAATETSAQLQTQATSYLTALFNRPEATGLTVTATYTASSSQVVVVSSANVKTNFMNLMGFSTMKVAADSYVKWGSSRLRVALVLDNTGSMADSGKISALITATNNLLTQLKAAVVNPGDVYVSIVPFVKDVNVGPSNYKATWIDWTDWNANNGSCSNSNYSDSQSDCTSHGKTWTAANHNTWNGCVTDRGTSTGPSTLNTDTNVTAPSTTVAATLLPAEQYDPCPQALMALNYNWSSMTTLVNAMSPGGNTNQAIGLQLGWMSLVGGGPFPAPPAMDPNYKYQQIIILLTDGLNTQDRWYTDQSSIDTREQMTCNNINTAGITLYTIQVNTSGDPTSSLLQKCAGSPGKYPDSSKFFLLTSSSQIVTTFQQIATNLSNLRIAQ
jgi:Flp pilus assembly protein TadG